MFSTQAESFSFLEENIVLRKEIKRIFVSFPCAEQGFCNMGTAAVVHFVPESNQTNAISYKNIVQIRLTFRICLMIFSLFDEFYLFDEF